MSDDGVRAAGDERVGGADGEFECEVGAESVEAVDAEEGAGDGEEGAGEEGGGGGGGRGEVRGKEGGEEEVEEWPGEGRWTVVAQREEDRAFEERPGPCQGLCKVEMSCSSSCIIREKRTLTTAVK